MRISIVVAGRAAADGLDRAHELRGTAVRQVVTVDRGDDDVDQPQLGHGIAQPLGLVRIDRARHPGLDVAEGAGPGAGVAQDHHRGVLLGPALADVRAGRLLADRVQPLAVDQPAGVVIAGRGGRLDPDPGGLAGDGGAVEDGDAGHGLRSVWPACRRQARPRASSRRGSGAGRWCGTGLPPWPPWSAR